jgi:hypothetical protein
MCAFVELPLLYTVFILLLTNGSTKIFPDIVGEIWYGHSGIEIVAFACYLLDIPSVYLAIEREETRYSCFVSLRPAMFAVRCYLM